MNRNEKELTKKAAKALKDFTATLTRIASKLDYDLEITEQDDEQVSFSLNGYPFTLSWGLTKQASLGRDIDVLEFSLCIWHETPGTRWSPPEQIDTTLTTTRSTHNCVQVAFETVAKDHIRIVMENDGYEQMDKEILVSEQA